MTPKIFITGVTGYIAGEAFHQLYTSHPDYAYSLLVRSKDKGEKLQQAHKNTRIVLGSLVDSSLLEEEAANADIVLHAADASDHLGAAKAIAAGMIRGHSRSKPGYWLHTGGAGILTYTDSAHDFAGLGCFTDKQYNDLAGVEELTSLPSEAFHRNVDEVVLETGTSHAEAVKTVIVCPPTIYGKGQGLFNTRSRQAYELASLILRKGYIPIVGAGEARWNNVHVADLGALYCALVDRAVSGDANPELFGAKGYMFAENGEHTWSELARLMATEAHRAGYIGAPEGYQLGKDEALEVAGFEAVSWGLNSRGKAERAREFLGWRPMQKSVEEEVPEILRAEKEILDAEA